MPETDPTQPSEKLFNAIKSYESGASRLTTWSLSIIGGSILIVTGNEYFRPINMNCRYVYSLFFVGWTFIGLSLYHAFSITQRAMVKDLYRNDVALLTEVLNKCNTGFKWQLKFFKLALLTFGVWLFLYMAWWITTTISPTK